MMIMNKTFKDFLLQDVNNVFLNENEFAETVIINKNAMKIVRDSDEMVQFNTDKKLASCDVVFHVESSYFRGIPQPERIMEFEGKEYRIKVVRNNLGMLTIGLMRYTE
ncbi:hypothetical protein BFM98_12790 [Lysinibacillus sp. AR18-8]|nr:hypothetical protein BFM98_12790 [Lysinibacillus sp. AR18-8]